MGTRAVEKFILLLPSRLFLSGDPLQVEVVEVEEAVEVPDVVVAQNAAHW